MQVEDLVLANSAPRRLTFRIFQPLDRLLSHRGHQTQHHTGVKFLPPTPACDTGTVVHGVSWSKCAGYKAIAAYDPTTPLPPNKNPSVGRRWLSKQTLRAALLGYKQTANEKVGVGEWGGGGGEFGKIWQLLFATILSTTSAL